MATLEAAGPSISTIACISASTLSYTRVYSCTRATRASTSPLVTPFPFHRRSLSHAMAPPARKMGIPRSSFSPPPSDQENVVNAPPDMERYLSELSLEYESVWDTKPAWCQPWTIILTGAIIVSLSWLTLRSVPITVVASLAIAAWWYIFLYSYPQAYSAMIAERRKRVSNGEEDIYGFKTSEK